MPLGILENGEILRGEFTAGAGEDDRSSDLETTRQRTAGETQTGMAPEPVSAKTVPGKSL